jgi:hypothetical protein
LKPFKAWGWRIPFLGSIFLLLISLYIRLQMEESPAFKHMKEEGTQSKAPLKEAFRPVEERQDRPDRAVRSGRGTGGGLVFGPVLCAVLHQQRRQAGQFTSNVLVAWSLILGTVASCSSARFRTRSGASRSSWPGCAGRADLLPGLQGDHRNREPGAGQAQANTEVTVTADPETCSFQFNPTGTAKFTSPCDIAKAMLAKSSVNYTSVDAPAGSPTTVTIAGTVIPSMTATLTGDELKAAKAAYEKSVNEALTTAGYPIDPKTNTTVAKADHFFDIFKARTEAGPADDLSDRAGDDGLWPDGRGTCRTVPDPHPLFRHVAALSYRQRLVRGPAAGDRLRDLGPVRQYLCGPVVCDRGRGDDGGDRADLRSGYEICKDVRDDPALSDTRILMMTARGSALEQKRGLELGADGFISKPFDLSELRGEIRRLLAS